MKRAEIIGNIYGNLTVVEFSHMKHYSHWNCMCKCGNPTTVSICNLTSGHTKSCGCEICNAT